MSDKIISNVKLNVKWKVSTSTSRPGTNTDTDGYVNENITDTLGKVVKYLNDLDSGKLDTSAVSTSGSYGSTGWSDCKLVNGKIKYYYTPSGSSSTDTNVTTVVDSSSKLYLTGTKYSYNDDNDKLWKNLSVYEQAGVIYAPDFNVANVGSVKDRINILSSKGTITATTIYDDTGLSVTLNKTGIWRIYGFMNYSNAKVTAVGLVINTYSFSYNEVRSGLTFAGISTSALMVDNGSHPTIKLYVQAQTEANNYCAIVAEYLCSNV